MRETVDQVERDGSEIVVTRIGDQRPDVVQRLDTIDGLLDFLIEVLDTEAEPVMDLTPEEAQELIESLNQRTRERIRENLQNQEQKEVLCECKEVLFDGIQALLDADQSALWVEWLAGLEDPCLDTI